MCVICGQTKVNGITKTMMTMKKKKERVEKEHKKWNVNNAIADGHMNVAYLEDRARAFTSTTELCLGH